MKPKGLGCEGRGGGRRRLGKPPTRALKSPMLVEARDVKRSAIPVTRGQRPQEWGGRGCSSGEGNES